MAAAKPTSGTTSSHMPVAMTPSGMRALLGTVQHVTDDPRYVWLNDRVCALEGEVGPRAEGDGFDVVLRISLMTWEPVTDPREQPANDARS